MLTTFERRQQILARLHGQSNVRVSELSKSLNVTEATIRNDLIALEKAKQLVRVRGGAALNSDLRPQNSPLAARPQGFSVEKQRIARWAADMVKDGDSIFLDASSVVGHMGIYLQDRKNLTVFTNGLEIGYALAQCPSITSILVGGIIRPDGTSVTGHLGGNLLEDFHIKTAFISCAGFSVEDGLTESDIQEAQLKMKVIQAASNVVALVDAGKFNQTSLQPFATLAQISHIVTDSNIDESIIVQIRQSETILTICGENSASSIIPHDTRQAHYKIGFANLSEDVPFALDVRHGLEQAAREAGNIDLIVADNQLDGQVALQVAEHLIAQDVDLVVEYQIDEKMNGLIMNRFQQANIPVIAVDIPMVGASFLGVDNYEAGHTAGVALGQWIAREWQGEIDRLVVLIEPRAGALPAARIQGQLDGLQSIIGTIPHQKIVYLDSENTTEVSESRMVDALSKWEDERRIAVVPFNSNATLGALHAARKLGREQDIVIVGQGGDRRLRQLIRHPDSRLIGSTAFMHEKYGTHLVAIALKILRGEAIPPATYIDHVFLTRDNVNQYYPDE